MCFSIVYLRQTNNRKNFKTFDADRVYVSRYEGNETRIRLAQLTREVLRESLNNTIYIYTSNQPYRIEIILKNCV